MGAQRQHGTSTSGLCRTLATKNQLHNYSPPSRLMLRRNFRHRVLGLVAFDVFRDCRNRAFPEPAHQKKRSFRAEYKGG